MKRRKLFTLSIATVVFLLCGLLSVGAFSPMDKLSEKYERLDMEAMIKTMQSMSYKEIGEEANTIASITNDTNSLFAHAAALYEKIDAIPEEWLIQEMQDSTNADMYRYFLIELSGQTNEGKGLSDLEPIREILLDPDESSIVRQNAIFALMYDEESFDILVKVVSDEDENVAFQALKAVNMIDPKTGSELADQIIKEKVDDDRFQMAIKVKAQEFQRNPGKTKDISEFISLCKELYQETDDQMMRFTTMFALSDLYQKEALRFIVEEESIDDGHKTACINQNYLVLKDMLDHNPTEDDIKFAIRCSKIVAVDEVVKSLKTAMASTKVSFSFEELTLEEIYPVKKIGYSSYSFEDLTFGEIHPAEKVWDESYYAGRS